MNDDADPNHHRPAEGRGDALVMFGLTGDLGDKKLFPALLELEIADRLGLPVVAVGRSEYSDDDLRGLLDDAADDHDDPAAARAAAGRIELVYVRGDVGDVETFERVSDAVGEADRPVVYAALPPDTFPTLADAIARSPMSDSVRLVVEKPFGEDAASARQLHEELVGIVGDDGLFVVDHFLAKAAVENLSTVRHANVLLDGVMNARDVEWIELEMSEAGDAAERGAFYDGVGAIDDVLQNHLLQTLALLMMERPDDSSDAAFHRSRHDLLRSIASIDPSDVVLGQYDGYRDHDGVADDSTVETYVDVRLRVDTDRWRGVPVRIRTGKALDADRTQATVLLRPASAAADAESMTPPTCVRFVLKPSARIELDLDVLDPDGGGHGVRRSTTCIEVPDDHDPLGDYATLLDAALDGRQRHFAQIGGIVEAWRIVEHARDGVETLTYAPGSNGPDRTSPGPWTDR